MRMAVECRYVTNLEFKARPRFAADRPMPDVPRCKLAGIVETEFRFL